MLTRDDDVAVMLSSVAPVRARLDDGRLVLFAASSEGAQQVDVSLVAQTAVLGLAVGEVLEYEVAFDNLTYNGRGQSLPSFRFAAPATDVVVDLASAAWLGS